MSIICFRVASICIVLAAGQYWPVPESFFIVRENKKRISLLIIDLTQSGVLAEGSDRLTTPRNKSQRPSYLFQHLSFKVKWVAALA